MWVVLNELDNELGNIFVTNTPSGIVRSNSTTTETVRATRDAESRTATSTFTQLLSSDAVFQLCITSTETTDY